MMKTRRCSRCGSSILLLLSGILLFYQGEGMLPDGRTNIDEEQLVTIEVNEQEDLPAAYESLTEEEVDTTDAIIFTSPAGTVVTRGDMDAFKIHRDIKSDVGDLPLQAMLPIPVESVWITVDHVAYSLAGLEPLRVFAAGVTTHWVDGVEVPVGPPTLFTKHVLGSTARLLVSMRNSDWSTAQDISSVSVTALRGGVSAEVVPIKGNDVFVTVLSTDIDEEAMNKKYSYGGSPP